MYPTIAIGVYPLNVSGVPVEDPVPLLADNVTEDNVNSFTIICESKSLFS